MKKVVAVGMFDSVHFARWLEQFQDQDLSFILFPSSPHRRIHPKLMVLLKNRGQALYSLVPLSRYFGLPLWILDKLLDNSSRGFLLRRVISNAKPDFVHALELQNAGYLVLKSLGKSKTENLKIIITNYGSDIFWFRRFPKHLQKLKALLALADIYSAECERDVALARELGFFGTTMAVRPNAGGFTEGLLSAPLEKAVERQTIAIKGYHGWVGRAHVAIEAISLVASQLREYRVVFYSSNLSTVRLARKLAKRTGLDIEINKKGALSHDQMLNLFGRSAVYVGLSESDGISTSLLEAMAMGAVPVQTSTACCDEWFSEETGVAIKNIEAGEVSKGILRALELSKLGLAAKKNRESIRNKASESLVKEASLLYYR
jgi:hypothetical protein